MMVVNVRFEENPRKMEMDDGCEEWATRSGQIKRQ